MPLGYLLSCLTAALFALLLKKWVSHTDFSFSHVVYSRVICLGSLYLDSCLSFNSHSFRPGPVVYWLSWCGWSWFGFQSGLPGLQQWLWDSLSSGRAQVLRLVWQRFLFCFGSVLLSSSRWWWAELTDSTFLPRGGRRLETDWKAVKSSEMNFW